MMTGSIPVNALRLSLRAFTAGRLQPTRKRRRPWLPATYSQPSLDRVRDVALTGVDIISVGVLTHAAAWVNISMDIEKA